MCLAVPARLEAIEAGEMGLVDHLGVRRRVSLTLVPEAEVGHYVLIHAGYAIQHLLPDEGEETLALLEELARAGGGCPSLREPGEPAAGESAGEPQAEE